MTTSSFRIATLLAAATAASFGAGSAALAQQTTVVVAPRYSDALRTVQVSPRDLDLRGSSGRKLLVSRIDDAAKKVCDSDLYQGGLDVTEQANCFNAAWAGARPQMYRAFDRAVVMASGGGISSTAAAIQVSAGF